jgi:hypothetical protein
MFLVLEPRPALTGVELFVPVILQQVGRRKTEKPRMGPGETGRKPEERNSMLKPTRSAPDQR